jgi:hypothetical protein
VSWRPKNVLRETTVVKIASLNFTTKKRIENGTKFSVIHMGQASRPPSRGPSSQESSSSKSVADAFDLVSRPLCDSGSTSMSLPPFPLSRRYSTALVLGTCVSQSAARAAMKSASYTFPASESTMRSSVKSHAFRPGMIPRFGGRSEACERAPCNTVV